jgi:hypothetical protein
MLLLLITHPRTVQSEPIFRIVHGHHHMRQAASHSSDKRAQSTANIVYIGNFVE